eukprot:GHVR01028651.1.p1 GENE.GHVR01028651.1~~GHVR01028651.1.p1  ORF type:complete len:161 (+),score=47.16 GHVR01028651.1:182-664(+)
MSSKSKGTSYTQLFYKTKICSSVYKGRPCSSGSACNFAHSDEEKRPLPDLRCTTLCKNVVSMGVCTVSHCPHAHAREELRISLVGEFKAKMCNFWKRGRCIDGEHCRFAHTTEVAGTKNPRKRRTRSHAKRTSESVGVVEAPTKDTHTHTHTHTHNSTQF